MDNDQLTPEQEYIARGSPHSSIFLHGFAGTGKTFSAIIRLNSLIDDFQGNQILILVPQKPLGTRYSDHLNQITAPYSRPTIVTLGGLSRRLVQLFWPMLLEAFPFSEPINYPTFLNLESAQYYMGKVIGSFYDQGFFRHVPLDKNRLASQLLDNLNKAAITGLTSDTIMQRLAAAWAGKPEQLVSYDEAQICINAFRSFCFQHQLLDYSLLTEVFSKAYLMFPELKQYVLSRYRHLIYDNIEEDVPIAHEFVSTLLDNLDLSLLIYDDLGGFRSFLGADPISARKLSSQCDQEVEFTTVRNGSEKCRKLGMYLASSIQKKKWDPVEDVSDFPFEFEFHPFVPDAIQAAIRKINHMVNEIGIPPNEIVVLSPYLNDILMHQFQQGLDEINIPNAILRPSRAMFDNPIVQSLTTLAILAHPEWNIPTNQYEIRNCLVQIIAGFDPLRADMLSRIIYPAGRKSPSTGTYGKIADPRARERIPASLGDKYDLILGWIEQYSRDKNKSLISFFRNLFEEILYQPGFSFWNHSGNIDEYAKLVKSIENFYSLQLFYDSVDSEVDYGKEYVGLLRNGIIPASYTEVRSEDTLTISPIHSFLMENRTVSYQLWFDVGSQGWWERLYQPLTHPAVLSLNWDQSRKWTDHDEVEYNRMALSRIIVGLTNRCGQSIYLYAIGRDEQGIDQKGPLLAATQNALRKLRKGDLNRAI